VHTVEAIKKLSTQRLRREHEQRTVFISKDLCTERKKLICILGRLFNIILKFNFATIKSRKTEVFY